MRVLSLPIGNDLLEIHINLWKSQETVYFNGQLASKKTHFIGTSHHFTTDAVHSFGVDHFRVVTSYGWMGFRYDVFKNDHCLLASGRTNVSAPKIVTQIKSRSKSVPHISRLDDPGLPDKELIEDLLV
ncbi:hypothetical protein [Neolewinella agarilytica]|uniref:hypothetical protein n=1 Tax=Neolewinella agarilytica TaxID=478744 RepID=UPI0023566E2B|nr:hypothetical protein [Neolewinella agarilytica]